MDNKTSDKLSRGKQQPKLELELENGTLEEATQSLGVIEDALNKLAVQTDAEYTLVTLKPMTEDQHKANKALREHLQERANE